MGDFGQISGHFAHFLPTFGQKSVHKKWAKNCLKMGKKGRFRAILGVFWLFLRVFW